MNDENQIPETSETPTVETQAAQPEQPAVETKEVPSQEPEQTYTKSQVIEMMKRRVERSHKSFFNRYSVKDLNEMDEKFNKIKEYEEQLLGLQGKNAELFQTNAFLRNNINPDRYEDIKTHFKGLGEDFTEDKLLELLTTHPDWVKPEPQPVVPETPTTTIKTLSPSRGHDIVETEDDKMKRIFGI